VLQMHLELARAALAASGGPKTSAD
jgi:hypothetical protein